MKWDGTDPLVIVLAAMKKVVVAQVVLVAIRVAVRLVARYLAAAVVAHRAAVLVSIHATVTKMLPTILS